MSASPAATPADLGAPDAAFRGVREIAPLLPPEDASTLALARSLLSWHSTHAYCPRCGHQTVMAEAGVDISHHRSTHLDELADVDFDYVVTVCSHAHESCPVFPGRATVLHDGFDDPPALARTAATASSPARTSRISSACAVTSRQAR